MQCQRCPSACFAASKLPLLALVLTGLQVCSVGASRRKIYRTSYGGYVRHIYAGPSAEPKPAVPEMQPWAEGRTWQHPEGATLRSESMSGDPQQSVESQAGRMQTRAGNGLFGGAAGICAVLFATVVLALLHTWCIKNFGKLQSSIFGGGIHWIQHTTTDATGPCGDDLASSNSNWNPPAQYLCPISCELMNDPVCTCEGITYEHAEIKAWLRTHNTDPYTNVKLSTKRLSPNVALRSLISDWKDEHPGCWDTQVAGTLSREARSSMRYRHGVEQVRSISTSSAGKGVPTRGTTAFK